MCEDTGNTHRKKAWNEQQQTNIWPVDLSWLYEWDDVYKMHHVILTYATHTKRLGLKGLLYTKLYSHYIIKHMEGKEVWFATTVVRVRHLKNNNHDTVIII